MTSLHDIELRHLRYFVAVAEEKHFGRAARRLFLSQPALSLAIAQLEERLGCTLIDRRDRRRIGITAGGEALLTHAREIDASVEAALRSVQQVDRRRGSALKIGYNDGEPLAQRPSALREAMRDASLVVSFRRLDWGSEAPMLRRGGVDVLLARLPIDTAGLGVLVIQREPRFLCVRHDHPITRKRSRTLRDLEGLPMVSPIGGSDEWRAFWRGVPLDRGELGPEVHSPEETFDVVMQGRAGCLVPASMRMDDEAGVKLLTVRGLPPCELAVVWRGRRSREVDAFAEAARLLSRG